LGGFVGIVKTWQEVLILPEQSARYRERGIYDSLRMDWILDEACGSRDLTFYQKSRLEHWEKPSSLRAKKWMTEDYHWWRSGDC
jgi:hypothetical protein